MPDTAANQAVYPQSRSQRPGVGFPLMRWVALIGLATGAVLGTAVGPWRGKETGESALFRTLLGSLRPGDVLVADRYYCSYWLIALAQVRGSRLSSASISCGTPISAAADGSPGGRRRAAD